MTWSAMRPRRFVPAMMLAILATLAWTGPTVAQVRGSTDPAADTIALADREFAAERYDAAESLYRDAIASGGLEAEFYVEDAAWRSTTVQNLVVADPAESIRRARKAGTTREWGE